MLIEKIEIKNFRNFKELEATFSKNLNVFVGQNGQGKTNLIEAIYLSTNGDSFRYIEKNSLINHKFDYSFINTQFENNNLINHLHIELTSGKKDFFLNKKSITKNKLKYNFNSIIFSPESLSIIKENDEQRRVLIDELLITFEKNNIDLLSRYKKTLKAKNKILKDYKDGAYNKTTCEDLILSINPIFLNLATEVTWKRIEAINNISNSLNDSMKIISNNQDIILDIDYCISDQSFIKSNKEIIRNFLDEKLKNRLENEINAHVSLVGPHKHEVKFLYNGNDSRIYCSQGQQRAIILSFKMAQIVYHRKAHGIYPILLLDDVLSELDVEKRNALIKFIHEINTQIFVTTTDFNLQYNFSLDNVSIFKFQDGMIHQS